MRIPRIKNAKFSGQYFYMNTNISVDFQICISVTLKKQFLQTWLMKATEFSRVFTRANLLQKKNSNTFPMILKKATNLDKLYLLPKTPMRLLNVPGRPVISNSGTPTEKASEFLDFHLKPLMQAAGHTFETLEIFLIR